jgi:cytidylate kinase
MAIITLSRELGSQGTEIADTLSSELSCQKIDKFSLEILLKNLGMADAQLAGDEEIKHGFWDQFSREKLRYLTFMKAALYRLALEKDCIIVGRGGNVLFQNIPGTLKLRVIAPLKVRVTRLCERLRVDEQQAVRMVRQSDHDRAGYHRYFFYSAWDSPSDYDITVNTAEITPAETCRMVSAIVRSAAFTDSAARAHLVLKDRRIESDIAIAIAYREMLRVEALTVDCKRGEVTLNGAVRYPATMDQAVRVAERVEGVEKVTSVMDVEQWVRYQRV